jgi:hypothetical protein
MAPTRKYMFEYNKESPFLTSLILLIFFDSYHLMELQTENKTKRNTRLISFKGFRKRLQFAAIDLKCLHSLTPQRGIVSGSSKELSWGQKIQIEYLLYHLLEIANALVEQS